MKSVVEDYAAIRLGLERIEAERRAGPPDQQLHTHHVLEVLPDEEAASRFVSASQFEELQRAIADDLCGKPVAKHALASIEEMDQSITNALLGIGPMWRPGELPADIYDQLYDTVVERFDGRKVEPSTLNEATDFIRAWLSGRGFDVSSLVAFRHGRSMVLEALEFAVGERAVAFAKKEMERGHHTYRMRRRGSPQ